MADLQSHLTCIWLAKSSILQVSQPDAMLGLLASEFITDSWFICKTDKWQILNHAASLSKSPESQVKSCADCRVTPGSDASNLIKLISKSGGSTQRPWHDLRFRYLVDTRYFPTAAIGKKKPDIQITIKTFMLKQERACWSDSTDHKLECDVTKINSQVKFAWYTVCLETCRASKSFNWSVLIVDC